MIELFFIDYKVWDDIFFMFYIYRNYYWVVFFKYMFYNVWCCNKLLVFL